MISFIIFQVSSNWKKRTKQGYLSPIYFETQSTDMDSPDASVEERGDLCFIKNYLDRPVWVCLKLGQVFKGSFFPPFLIFYHYNFHIQLKYVFCYRFQSLPSTKNCQNGSERLHFPQRMTKKSFCVPRISKIPSIIQKLLLAWIPLVVPFVKRLLSFPSLS